MYPVTPVGPKVGNPLIHPWVLRWVTLLYTRVWESGTSWYTPGYGRVVPPGIHPWVYGGYTPLGIWRVYTPGYMAGIHPWKYTAPYTPWVYHGTTLHPGPAHPAAHGVLLPDNEALGSEGDIPLGESLPES